MNRRLILLTFTLLLALTVPAGASPRPDIPYTIGSHLTLAPDPTGFTPSGEVQALQQTGSGLLDAAPLDGVLTRWRLRSVPTAGDTVLQVLRPDSDGSTFTVVAESDPVHVTSTAITTVEAHLPVQAGDRIGVRSEEAVGGASDLGAIAADADATIVTNQPPALLHATWTPSDAEVGEYRLLVQADVEPDGDHDGKGDFTQDSADLVLTGSAPAQVANQQPWSMTYTIRNDGPDTALNVVLGIDGGGVAPGTASAGMVCTDRQHNYPGGADVTCRLAALPVGASVTVAPGFIVPTIFPPPGGTFATKATVSATTPDPDTTNNTASLTTFVAPPPPYLPNIPPAAPFVIKPCTNIIRGTRDDDVVRGTAFGDRLVGGDGDDLLKGQGAGDCLEGGTGDDVLDGGDGDDRLAGSSGRDRLNGGTGNDKLTAGKGNDRLIGGPGSDTMSPGSGRDVVDAGGGNDTINSVDGVKETIDCGAGRDTVRADRRDRLKHCEKVTRR